ncbi:MAG TPA: outer membrane beta-barrel protein [Nitrospiraceae bacterium]|nr:outer membrane beta-barrel protein [Nitrospiraceae bacterium]
MAVCCAVASASPVQAEFVAELYGGGSFTNNADVNLTSPSFGGTAITFQGVKFNTSWTVGGRVGYWFKELGGLGAFGVGLDVFTFRANSGQQNVQLNIAGSSLGTFQIASIDISTVAIGFDVLRFRLHLAKSDEFQQGQIQPYMSAGPALFVTETTDGGNIFPANQSSTKTSVGVKAGAGLNVHITPAWSLFGEYRFTHFTSEPTFISGPPFVVSEITTETDFNTHHAVGGISFHF